MELEDKRLVVYSASDDPFTTADCELIHHFIVIEVVDI